MAEDSQTFPLAHYEARYKSDAEHASTITALKNERSNKCFIYVFSAFVFLSVAVLIFALVVLRVNSPSIELSSVSLSKFSLKNVTNSSSSAPSSFNFTLIAEIAVDNSNFGPFNFDDGTVGVMYGGAIVGQRSTGGGRAKAKGTKRMNVTVDAAAANSSHGGNFSSDFRAGNLKLSSFVKLRGRVRLIHIFRKRTTSEINCEMNLDLNSRQIQQNWVCE